MPQPCYQHSQAWTVSFGHGREFQAQPAGRFYMAHDSIGADLSLLDKEINCGCCSQRPCGMCFQEKTAETNILDGRDIVSTVATPIHQHAVPCINAGGSPPGKGRLTYEDVHTTPDLGPAEDRPGSNTTAGTYIVRHFTPRLRGKQAEKRNC